MWVPAWETMSGGIRCLRLYEVLEIPCKSMAVFWHFFYCPGKGIPDNKKYFVGYHTLYGMEPKWYCSFFCAKQRAKCDACSSIWRLPHQRAVYCESASNPH